MRVYRVRSARNVRRHGIIWSAAEASQCYNYYRSSAVLVWCATLALETAFVMNRVCRALILVGFVAAGVWAEPTAEDAAPLLIEGQTFNYMGAGLEGATVSVYPEQEGQPTGEPLAITTTDDVGDFSLELPAGTVGTVIVVAEAPGFVRARESVELDPNGPSFVAFELIGLLTVHGVVKADGKPLPGARVRVESFDLNRSATADDEGRFAIESLSPGSFTLVVEAEGYARLREGLDIAGEGVAPIALELKPEKTAHLKIIDEHGKPVAGAAVEVYTPKSQDIRTFASDDQGHVDVRGIGPDVDQLHLRISHPRYVSSQEFDRTVEMPVGRGKVEATVSLITGATLSGTVVDAATRRPLHGARIVVGRSLESAVSTEWSDMKGRFEVTGTSPGKAVVTVYHSGHAPFLKEVDAPAGRTLNLTIAMSEPAELAGVVVDGEGKPVAGAYVEAGAWRERNTLGLRAMTGPDGRFTIRDAPADEFALNVSARRYDDLSDQKVKGGQSDLRFVLMPATRHPTDEGSGPAPGQDAPDLTLTTLAGEKIVLSEQKGKVVLLVFWATWCGPCVAEFPTLREIYEKHGKRDDFLLIAVSLGVEEQALGDFIKQHKLAWPQVLDGATEAADAYGVRGIPANYLINREGKIADTYLRDEALRKAIDDLLKTPASPP